MFFFTDVAKIIGQSQGFGPAADRPEYRFQLTSRFFVQQGALAFAALGGTVLVQQVENSTSLVNIALRVLLEPDSVYAPTAYIIYRGIRLDSLLVPSAVAQNSTYHLALAPRGANDLLTQLWADKDASRLHTASLSSALQDTATDPNIFSLGWDLNAKPDTMTLEEAFNHPRVFQLADVLEGSSLGTFDDQDDIGIDIILPERFATPTLATVRQHYNILEVSPQDSNTLAYESYALRSQREALLAYIDPCAWFALRAEAGIHYKQAGQTKRALGHQQVYDEILTYFSTKNNIYVDLRNETSHSLRFYQEYPVGTSASEEVYYPFIVGTSTSVPPSSYNIPLLYRWPLYILGPQAAQMGSFPSSTAGIADVFSALQFRFQKTYNPDPLVYLEYAFLTRDFTQLPAANKRFVSENPALGIDPASPSNPWSQPVWVQTPTVGPPGSPANYCWVVKLMVLRQDVPATLPPTALPRRNYLDNIFGPLLPLPSTSQGVDNAYPVIHLGKRWFYLSSQRGGRLGAIVDVVLQYTPNEAFFTATLLDLYGDDERVALTPSKLQVNGWPAGPAISIFALSPPPAVTVTDNFLQAWATTTLGQQMRKFQTTTPLLAPAAVLGVESKTANVDAVGFLSLLISRVEYHDLYNTATVIFDTAVGDTSLEFEPFSYGKTTNLLDPRLVYSSFLQMGGLVPGGTYQTTFGHNPYLNQDYNAMPYTIPLVSLDGFRFNSGGAGLTSPAEAAAVHPTYPVDQLIEDVQKAEYFYFTKSERDTRIDQFVTRLRVHYYGYTYDKTLGKTGGLTPTGKGYIFNLVIPDADYWEDNTNGVGSIVPGSCSASAFRDVPPAGYLLSIDPTAAPYSATTVGCRVRQLYTQPVGGVTEVPLAVYERLTSGLKIAVDPAGLRLDLSHAVYTFDSLFESPIPGRAPTRRTSQIIADFGIPDPADLPNYIGDITGTLAVSYANYHKSTEVQQKGTLDELLQLEYVITSPIADLAGDADGYGFYDVWVNVFNKRQNVRFSEILARYYTSTLPSHTYKQRWKTFCLSIKLLLDEQNGTYTWQPNLVDLNRRIEAGYRFGYYPESTDNIAFAKHLASRGVFSAPTSAPRLLPAHQEYILTTFLTQVKQLLVNENSCKLNN